MICGYGIEQGTYRRGFFLVSSFVFSLDRTAKESILEAFDVGYLERKQICMFCSGKI